MRDVVNSYGSTESLEGLYQSVQSPPVCRRGPSWGRSSLSRTRLQPAVIAIVQHHGFKVHAFADDLQIYGSTAQSGAADLMARMSDCVESVRLAAVSTELVARFSVERKASAYSQ